MKSQRYYCKHCNKYVGRSTYYRHLHDNIPALPSSQEPLQCKTNSHYDVAQKEVAEGPSAVSPIITASASPSQVDSAEKVEQDKEDAVTDSVVGGDEHCPDQVLVDGIRQYLQSLLTGKIFYISVQIIA